MKCKMLAIMFLIAGNAHAGLTAIKDVHANPSSGFHGNSIPVLCAHHIYVTNNNSKAVTATAYYRLCAGNAKCDEVKIIQRMEANVAWEHSFVSQYAYTFRNAGNYELKCTTSVDGAGSNEDHNNIQVY